MARASPITAALSSGLPSFYKLSLGFRVLRVCAAATACTVAWTLLTSCVITPAVIFAPWAYVAVELVFAIYAHRLWHKYNKLPHDASPATYEEAFATFDRVLAAMHTNNPSEPATIATSAASWLRTWFHGKPLSCLQRSDIKDLIAYAFWFSDRATVESQGHAGALDAMANRVAAVLGPAGAHLLDSQCQHDNERECGSRTYGAAQTRNQMPAESKGPNGPARRFMAHMHEDLPHFYRPLIVYAVFEALAWMNHCMLLAAGYRCTARKKDKTSGDSFCHYYTANMHTRVRCNGMSATSKQHMDDSAAEAATATPIVFLHGVGMGLLPYLRLMVALAATGAPIMAFEFKHVSQRWAGPPPSLQQLAGEVEAALAARGCSRAVILAHSFGTAVASVLRKARPSLVQHMTLMDPIVFQMYVPRLLRNFIYRRIGCTVWDELEAADASTEHATTGGAAGNVASVAAGGLAAAAAAPTVAAASAAAAAAATLPVAAAAAVLPRSGPGSAGSGGVLGWRHACRALVVVARVALGLPHDLLMLGPAREMHCTALLCRRVVWRDVNMWEDEVSERCMVVLAGRDDLTCARTLERWLRTHTPARVLLAPHIGHAQICMEWGWQDTILDRLLRDAYGPEAAAAAAAGQEGCIGTADEDGDATAVAAEEGYGLMAQEVVAVAADACAALLGACGSGLARPKLGHAGDDFGSAMCLSAGSECEEGKVQGAEARGRRRWGRRAVRHARLSDEQEDAASPAVGSGTGGGGGPCARPTRHDSAGSYLRLPSAEGLVQGGCD